MEEQEKLLWRSVGRGRGRGKFHRMTPADEPVSTSDQSEPNICVAFKVSKIFLPRVYKAARKFLLLKLATNLPVVLARIFLLCIDYNPGQFKLCGLKFPTNANQRRFEGGS